MNAKNQYFSIVFFESVIDWAKIYGEIVFIREPFPFVLRCEKLALHFIIDLRGEMKRSTSLTILVCSIRCMVISFYFYRISWTYQILWFVCRRSHIKHTNFTHIPWKWQKSLYRTVLFKVPKVLRLATVRALPYPKWDNGLIDGIITLIVPIVCNIFIKILYFLFVCLEIL